MPPDFGLDLPGIGNDQFESGVLKQSFFQAEKGQVKGAEGQVEALEPGIIGPAARQPFPVAAVSGPVGILAQGPLQAENDVEPTLLQHPPGVDGKAQDPVLPFPARPGPAASAGWPGRPGPAGAGVRR